MRKTLIALAAAAAVTATAASPALSNPRHHHHYYGHNHGWVAPLAGAGVGTAVGFGLYNGWFGTSNSLTAGTLANSAAGAAAGGFIAGVGTVALLHAATTPCQGFHALFGGSGCVNGQYVGDQVAYRR